MHKNFGEWYRLVALEPDGTKLQKRWAGVNAWLAALRKDDVNVLETVRIFQGIPSKTSKDAFIAVFQKQDPSFPQRNDLELQVLAGASLVACVQNTGADGAGLHTAIVAGAALESSSLRATEPRLDEISREVLGGLQAIGVKQRERKPFDSEAVEDNAGAAVEAMMQISTIATWENNKSVITPIFQALVDAVRAADVKLSRVAHSLRRADEETNILWWVEGGCSRDTNKPWAALKDGAAIIAGVELADLTDVALGPRDAAALLQRVLSESKSKDSSLATYVNALPDEWVQARVAKAVDSALDLTPLTLAIVSRGKSDTASWQQYFDASSGMKSSTRLPVARVARQAYVEAILLRALADVDTEE
jgi:hypothetical protein